MSIRQTYLVTEGEQMNEKQRQKVTEGESVVRMGEVQKQSKQKKNFAWFKGYFHVDCGNSSKICRGKICY